MSALFVSTLCTHPSLVPRVLAPLSGDVDILVTHPSWGDPEDSQGQRVGALLASLAEMERRGGSDPERRFITGNLTFPSAVPESVRVEVGGKRRREFPTTRAPKRPLHEAARLGAADDADVMVDLTQEGAPTSSTRRVDLTVCDGESAGDTGDSDAADSDADSDDESPPAVSSLSSSSSFSGRSANSNHANKTAFWQRRKARIEAGQVDGTLHSRARRRGRRGGSYESDEPSYHAAWMGFCRVPPGHAQHSGVHRRLDLKFYSAPHFPFALLYFTGSDHFNRSMRYFSKTKGWTLSDAGLAKAVRYRGSRVCQTRSVFAVCEKDIFDVMGLKYVPPNARSGWDNFEDMSDKAVPSGPPLGDDQERRVSHTGEGDEVEILG